MIQATSNRRIVSRAQGVLLATSCMLAIATASAAGPQLNLAQQPLYTGGNISPMVMIDLTKDHTLHQKAYNDYTDLDGDGQLDTTYKNSIEYAGYFDSKKCYDYDSATIQGFVPKSVTTTRYCDGKTWSGNFLNWATMSRIDEVRKILYGGMRSTDTENTTVLERAFLPTDAHAWAKFYDGADVAQLVPFTVEVASAVGTLRSTTPMTLSSAVAKFWLNDFSQVEPGDQLRFEPTSGAAAGTSMTGWVMRRNPDTVSVVIYDDDISNPGNTRARFSSWKVTNLARGGLTLCNVTPQDPWNVNSQGNRQAPQIRVVAGNYAMWGSSEHTQCKWSEEARSSQRNFLPRIDGTQIWGSSNGNRVSLSGINASAENPSQLARGLGSGQETGVFNARVQVCVPGLIGSENCKQYGSNFKPYGLLQKYGESGQMQFGLMTGSYDRNISGGVLRRNVTNFASETDPDTGIFTYGASRDAINGIVWNIDRLRPYGYSYRDGSYVNADQCNYQQTSIELYRGYGYQQDRAALEGNCSTWGNPISEIFVETLRYFGGKTPTSAFQPSNYGKDATLGLTRPAWANPMDLPPSHPNRAPYCTPLNALVFNSSVSSYDNDQLGGFRDLNGSPDISAYTNSVGIGEGIPGSNWFAGGISGSTIDNLCSAKPVNNFSDVLGICPEGPSQRGTFQIAGAAYFAKTNRLRSPAQAAALGVPERDTTSLQMNTYAVQLATNTPKISVDVNGKTVTIMPAHRLHPQYPNYTRAPASTGTLVDFKVISQTATSGKFYVNWEDSVAGGDYDQDSWGILSYTVSGDTITVSTRVVSVSSSNGQGFGYTISGTTQDGPHFHSGVYDFQYIDPVPVTVSPQYARVNRTGGCHLCNFGDPETSVTYTANGRAGSQFQDPLLYAAKWGGFKDLNGNGIPDLASEWDVRLADGSGGSDGLPDNYFYATNPGALSAALERAFLSILKTSSFSAVAASSSSLQTDTTIFQARFNSADWSGQLQAYALDKNGDVITPARWDAANSFKGVRQTDRRILTYNTADNTSAGIPFRWASLPPAYRAALDGEDMQGSRRVLWLRGHQVNEGDGASQFRSRPVTVLGDIVSSSPQFVGSPAAGYDDESYLNFVVANRTRKPMLYVGANDGMLHAFSADMTPNGDGGKEVFAYVPSPLYGKLANLTSSGYVHNYYVDGTPKVTDAYFNNRWRTVLVGGLGGGGKGIYALDVTNPTAIRESNASSTVLWEFTSHDDADLGYTYGKPNIVRLGNGKWAAIFGNGLNSTEARGAIFIVFLDRAPGNKRWKLGTDYLKLTVNDATAARTRSNGIVQLYVSDTNGDAVADAIYAGDLHGNVWKFNVGGKVPADYQGTRQLLFTATDAAGNPQPITTTLSGTRHRSGGHLVMFGTGRYVDVRDPADMSTQAVYGIWDKGSTAQPTITRSQLVQQSITMEPRLSNGDTYRVLSKNRVSYATGAMGWYLNLTTPGSAPDGERVVFDPQLQGTRLMFSTLTPSADLCAGGGTGWQMAIDGLSGGQSVSMYDVNGDGQLNGADRVGGSGSAVGQAVSGKKSNELVTNATVLGDHAYLSGNKEDPTHIKFNSDAPAGRVSWRQIQQ